MSTWYRPLVRQPLIIVGVSMADDVFTVCPGMLLQVNGTDEDRVAMRVWLGPHPANIRVSCVQQLLDDRRVFATVSPLELLAQQAIE